MPCCCSSVERCRAVHRIFSAVWRKKGKACVTSSNCGRKGTRAGKGKRGRGRMCLCPSYTAQLCTRNTLLNTCMQCNLACPCRDRDALHCSLDLVCCAVLCCAVPLNQLFAAPFSHITTFGCCVCSASTSEQTNSRTL